MGHGGHEDNRPNPVSMQHQLATSQLQTDILADVNCQKELQKKSFKANDNPSNPSYNPTYGRFQKYNYEYHESYESQR